MRFWNYAQNQNIYKTNKLKVLGRKKTKGPKHDDENRLRSPMHEGGHP